jgi:hypothetical protein
MIAAKAQTRRRNPLHVAWKYSDALRKSEESGLRREL